MAGFQVITEASAALQSPFSPEILHYLTTNHWPTFTPPQWPGFTPPLTPERQQASAATEACVYHQEKDDSDAPCPHKGRSGDPSSPALR
jgi:hypothetical protein